MVVNTETRRRFNEKYLSKDDYFLSGDHNETADPQ